MRGYIMTEEKFTYEYYIVGSRPVKVELDDDGLESDCQVLNWKTGKFERDLDYLDKIGKPGSELEVKEVDEETFNKTVKGIKDKKKRSNLIKPGM
jgi:hypothetical protein